MDNLLGLKVALSSVKLIHRHCRGRWATPAHEADEVGGCSRT
jgi:hypothetical protein